ncbi:MAG TPA: FAD-dependent monooxygenase [Amycolatopsis sp.]|uniref:FAD-dependent monooxygenase n=1 Tax=Amycolatopsis sp. TaxID=37632 RepID=UPI002B46CC33|nr:FAD-dependent monooxygenase [Amycolatopsis sp.]HKS47190.1 FAD-dependent monooxygenase [Amycolatopsis sp.]
MDVPVVVVGAGPSGLMLAGELGLAGLDVLVVERLETPTRESRGLGFAPRTMEVFQQRGLLGRFGDIVTSSAGHFGGLPVDFGLLDGAERQGRPAVAHGSRAGGVDRRVGRADPARVRARRARRRRR